MTVRFIKEDENSGYFEFMVTPFGSPDNRDAHQEYFTKETDFGASFGWDTMPKLTVLGHLIDPDTPYPDAILGVAVYKSIDDAGRWFELQLSKSHKYYQYIKRLIEMGLMGTSSQAYRGAVKHHEKQKGQITTWIENELTWTVSPASPDTVSAINNLRKELGMEGIAAEAVTSEASIKDAVEAVLQEVPVVKAALADQPPASTVDLAGVTAKLDEIIAAVNVLPEIVNAVKSANDALTATNALIKTQEQSIKDALVNLANYMKRLRQIELEDNIRLQSAVESQVVKELKESNITKAKPTPGSLSKLPPHAPGTSYLTP